ncbi:ROK family transcriptional regulator [Oryzibacter oryziterrae]|uniref:ROK family transcriptional regulator n=1 Tax=Oryzibacter oryziterrae TaxID=2766474 RepID=UPI001F403FCE|nr:ROK family transcriptional regulator [Oryzibacter oryziterrae]
MSTLESQTTSIARKVTTQAVMRTVLAEGAISRTDVARLTGLSKQTVSEIVRSLEDDGWLKPSGRTDGRLGRQAITYEINADAAHGLAIDVGGTKVAAAIGDLLGNIKAEVMLPTDPRGGTHLVDHLGRVVEQLAAEAGVALADLRVAVLGTPGVFDPETGHVRIAPNVPGLENIDLRQLMGDRLGCPVIVENDVNLAALGEQWRGQGAELNDFAFVALGTGIGMGIIANRRLVRGARGAAGEISYLPLGADPFDPRNFTVGTLEAAVGAAAITRRFAGYGGPSDRTVKDVFAALAEGDGLAAAAIEETARLVAVTIASVGAVLDPEVVILGGSIGARDELVAAIRRFLPRCTPTPPPIAISRFGNRAGLIGGISVAVAHMLDELFGIPLDQAAPSVGRLLAVSQG